VTYWSCMWESEWMSDWKCRSLLFYQNHSSLCSSHSRFQSSTTFNVPFLTFVICWIFHRQPDPLS
jgi:hypothetical protein